MLWWRHFSLHSRLDLRQLCHLPPPTSPQHTCTYSTSSSPTPVCLTVVLKSLFPSILVTFWRILVSIGGFGDEFLPTSKALLGSTLPSLEDSSKSFFFHTPLPQSYHSLLPPICLAHPCPFIFAFLIPSDSLFEAILPPSEALLDIFLRPKEDFTKACLPVMVADMFASIGGFGRGILEPIGLFVWSNSRSIGSFLPLMDMMNTGFIGRSLDGPL